MLDPTNTIDTLVADAVATLTLTRVEPFSPGDSRWRPTDIVYDIVAILPVTIDVKPSTINGKSHGKIFRRDPVVGDIRRDHDRSAVLV